MSNLLRVDIRAENIVQLFLGDVFDFFLYELNGSVVYENIEPLEFIESFFNCLLAKLLALNVTLDTEAFATLLIIINNPVSDYLLETCFLLN